MRGRRKGDGRRFNRKVFLWELLALAESLSRPSLTRSLTGFEERGFQGDISRHIHRLEVEAYLERQPGEKRDRLYRLTAKGRLAALGGLDPVREWGRPWDGRWRFFCFDMPADRAAERSALLRALRDRRFGCLQGSLWISPDPADQIRRDLKGDRHPNSLIVLEGTPCAGEEHSELVESAWDFDEISRRWSLFDQQVCEGARRAESRGFQAGEFWEWCGHTRQLWAEIVEVDPFLPATLLPAAYQGQRIWRKKEKAFRRMAEARTGSRLG